MPPRVKTIASSVKGARLSSQFLGEQQPCLVLIRGRGRRGGRGVSGARAEVNAVWLVFESVELTGSREEAFHMDCR